MTEHVQITISGARHADGQREDVEMTAAGEYFEKDGVRYVRYDEGEGTDLVRNMMKIRPDQMEIVKRGAVSARMIFRQGEKTATSYMTPAGQLLVEIKTSRFELFQDGGQLKAVTEYSLAINGQPVSDNRIAVTVAPAG